MVGKRKRLQPQYTHPSKKTNMEVTLKELNRGWELLGGFDAPAYAAARWQEVHFEKNNQVVQVAEGSVKCHKCGSFRLKAAEAQLRNCDEKSTVFYRCEKEGCNFSWSE